MFELEAAAASSRISSVPTAEKILLLVGLTLCAVAVNPTVVAVPLIIAFIWAKPPLKLYLPIIGFNAVFVGVGMIPLVWNLTSSGIVAVPGGFSNAALVWWRCVVAASGTLLFACTTPLSDIISWARRVHIPASLTYVVQIMYRMVGALWQTFVGMREAAAQRLSERTFRTRMHSTGLIGASLFVVAFMRARSMQEALELRADPLDVKTFHSYVPARPARLVAIALVLVATFCVGYVL
ncbi:energy-coupling factor transporter transmembrane component T family protein [Corynebacterium pyruviciproducens]